MKIALCLSGQMRAMRYCIDSVNTAFPECDIDVFATVWDYEDEENINILKDKFNVIFLDRVSNNHLKKYSEFEVESLERGFKNVENVENWAPVPVWNLTRIELMAQNSFNATRVKNYDYIVRSRYDTRYLTNLIPMLDDSSILLSEDIGGSAPWDTWKGTRSVFDGFAVGSYYDMAQYYNFVDWLPSYFNHHQDTLKAERTMGWYLSNIAKLNCRYARDILGIQINKDEWYNRTYPNQAKSLKSKQKGTFDFYKQDLQKNHPLTYNKIKHVFND